MVEAVIVSTARTPIGKAVRGAYNLTHGADLGGRNDASALQGGLLMGSWGGRTTKDLIGFLEGSMPPTNPGGLGEPTYLAIAAFILDSNGARVHLNGVNWYGAESSDFVVAGLQAATLRGLTRFVAGTNGLLHHLVAFEMPRLSEEEIELLAIAPALVGSVGVGKLAYDEQAARLVKLRYFAGLAHQEAAEALGLGRRAADRLWALARAWLYQRLHGE